MPLITWKAPNELSWTLPEKSRKKKIELFKPLILVKYSVDDYRNSLPLLSTVVFPIN